VRYAQFKITREAGRDSTKPSAVPIWSINPNGRLNGEIRRRTDVVGIFPNRDSFIRLGELSLPSNTMKGSSPAAISASMPWPNLRPSGPP
jgi:transposase-like protein